MNPLLSTLLILGLMAAVVIVFRTMIRRPTTVRSADPPGVRTVAVFCGDDPELFDDDQADGPLVGVRLFHALCDGLAAAGVTVEARGTIHNAQRAECLVQTERFALVLEWVKPRWVASVEWIPLSAAERRHVRLTSQVFSPPDSIQLRRLLMALDGWLKSHAKLSDVRWHRKELWIAEDTSDAAETPVSRSVVG